MSKKWIIWFSLGVLLLGAAGFLWNLIDIRFKMGTDYPPYSTFRYDPLGCSGLYEALHRIPNIRAERNLQSLLKLGNGKGHTLLLLGSSISPDENALLEAIERFVHTGGRIVIAFYSQIYSDQQYRNGQLPANSPTKENTGMKDSDKHDGENTNEIFPYNSFDSIERRWGFAYEHEKIPRKQSSPDAVMTVNRKTADTPSTTMLPETLPWHSEMYFSELTPEWRPIYTKEDGPDKTPRVVVMERSFGDGTIVCCSDSYLLSNEGLHDNRKSGFVLWMMGNAHSIVFDETHLGLELQSGVMTLVYKYRLTGIMAALVAMTLLFVWKNATTLIPRRAFVNKTNGVSAYDATEALVNLLRRNISPHTIVITSVRQWENGLTAAERQQFASKRERIRGKIEQQPNEKRPAPDQMYREIQTIIAEKESKREH